jgi:hypothetical protein
VSPELTERELGYIEGILDGEGTVTLCKQKRKPTSKKYTYYPLVSVSNTDIRILQHIKELLGGGTIRPFKWFKEHRPKSKTLYRYVMTRPLMREVLPQLELISKDVQRLMLIDALQIFEKRKGDPYTTYGDEELEAIYQEMKRLNKRGKKDGGDEDA